MKFLLIIYFFGILFLSSCSENFTKLSEQKSDIENLLKNIIPNKNIQYWQLESVPNWKDESKNSEIIFSKGQSITKIKPLTNEKDWNGFFSGCQPSYCAYQITYLENDKWKTVKSEAELQSFIDRIDNESEAFLIGKINGYDIDFYSKKGNGFIKKENGYKIKMMKYNNCPESKESFSLFIEQNGKISESKSNGFYLKSKNCIIY
jgi:hypothetical protein